jgi:hypothetical protein
MKSKLLNISIFYNTTYTHCTMGNCFGTTIKGNVYIQPGGTGNFGGATIEGSVFWQSNRAFEQRERDTRTHRRQPTSSIHMIEDKN